MVDNRRDACRRPPFPGAVKWLSVVVDGGISAPMTGHDMLRKRYYFDPKNSI
jgi:hypothetical protein